MHEKYPTPCDLVLKELREKGIVETKKVAEELRSRYFSVATINQSALSVSVKPEITENFPFYGPHFESTVVITEGSK